MAFVMSKLCRKYFACFPQYYHRCDTFWCPTPAWICSADVSDVFWCQYCVYSRMTILTKPNLASLSWPHALRMGNLSLVRPTTRSSITTERSLNDPPSTSAFFVSPWLMMNFALSLVTNLYFQILPWSLCRPTTSPQTRPARSWFIALMRPILLLWLRSDGKCIGFFVHGEELMQSVCKGLAYWFRNQLALKAFQMSFTLKASGKDCAE